MFDRKNIFKYRLLSSMEKVLPGREPTGDGASVCLCGLRGETVSFQIGYFWGGERTGRGSIVCSEVKGVKVTARIVALSPCGYPCHQKRDEGYLVTEPGMYPDLLRDISEFGFPLVAGQWRSLWIDLEISEDAPAGERTLIVDLKELVEPDILISQKKVVIQKESVIQKKSVIQKEPTAKKERIDLNWSVHPDNPVNMKECSYLSLGQVEVSLEILDGSLPMLDIPHTEWFHCDCLADYYGVEVFSERHWEIIENFVRTAAKRGCNMLLTPLFTPPLDTAVGGERTTVQLVDVWAMPDGSYSFGFQKLVRWIMMAKRCGIRFFEMNHLFSQWGAVYPPKVIVWRDGKKQQLFGWGMRADGEEYRDFLKQFLEALDRELKTLDIREQCFFHISDEPSKDQLQSYCAAKAVVEEKLKGYRIIDALSDFEFYKTGVIKEPVCASDHLEPFLADRPERLWTYYCTAQCVDVSNRFIALPGYRTRILAVQLYKYRIDGFLHWGYNFYNSEYSLYPINPYACTDADGAFPSGDSFLVYPGEDGKPEESIRLMLMDEVFSDYRAMKYLESLTNRQTVLDCLEEASFGELNFKKFPQNAAYVARVRDNVNRELKKVLFLKKSVLSLSVCV